MTRRRTFSAIAVFAVLWSGCSGFAGVFPCDATNSMLAHAQDVPTPQPPDVSVVVKPKIEGPTSIKHGTMGDFKLTYTPPAGARVKVRWESPDSDIRPFGTWEIYATAKPGPRVLNATVIVVTETDIDDYDVSFAYTVEGQPGPPEPAPLPSLADLIPDPKHREQVATFFADLAGVVRAGGFTSTGHFRAGQALAVKTAQQAGALPAGLAAINKPVSDRLAAAVGLADVPLDEAKTKALADALDAIAAEFKGK